MEGWKTLIFGAILAIAGVLEQFDWLSVVPEGWGGIIVAAIGIIVAWLRSVTKGPSALAGPTTIAKAKTVIGKR